MHVYPVVVSHQVMSDSSVSVWTAAHWASLSMEFPSQVYWSGWSFPSPGHIPDPGIKPESPALQAISCIIGRFFITKPLGKTILYPIPL